MSQGGHRVQLHCADRGEIAGDGAGDEEDEGGGEEGDGVGSREAEDHVGDQACGGEGARDADQDADEREENGFTKNELKDASALRAHRHADSYLAGAEGDGI